MENEHASRNPWGTRFQPVGFQGFSTHSKPAFPLHCDGVFVMPSTFVQEKLPNGLTVVIESLPHVRSVACGFLVRTGARDDTPQLAGVSHFLEHMCFKGTATRDSIRINVEFDEMGAQYNAFTSKDRTFYYGWVRAEDFERQLELLADMMRSTLPEPEFETEKSVVLEEIAMSRDDLASTAYDALYENVCADSEMSWPILGYERTIQALTRDQMHAYFRRRYAPDNLVLIVAGNVAPDRVLAAAGRYCGPWAPAGDGSFRRHTPPVRTGSATRVCERFHQQAVMIAYPAAAGTDPMDETADATAAILGGVNSRFYWNIMQKGLSTRAGVFRDEYTDFGLTILFALCEPENCEKVCEAMRHEAAELTARGTEPKEIQRVRNLRRTSLAVESEAPFYRLGQIADDVEYLGAPRSPEQRLAAVNAVSAESVAEYLRRFPITGEGFLVSVGPRQWPA
ncbi:MAG: peptidase M16 [Phycisphaerae bacterium]